MNNIQNEAISILADHVDQLNLQIRALTSRVANCEEKVDGVLARRRFKDVLHATLDGPKENRSSLPPARREKDVELKEVMTLAAVSHDGCFDEEAAAPSITALRNR